MVRGMLVLWNQKPVKLRINVSMRYEKKKKMKINNISILYVACLPLLLLVQVRCLDFALGFLQTDCSECYGLNRGESRAHSCVVLTGGVVRCWGNNEYGQLGYGHTNNIGDDENPASAGDVNVGGIVTQIAVGRIHTCALLNTGAVRCWGNNEHGGIRLWAYK